MTPAEKSAGFEGLFAVSTEPSGRSSTRSVNVPPVSTPIDISLVRNTYSRILHPHAEGATRPSHISRVPSNRNRRSGGRVSPEPAEQRLQEALRLLDQEEVAAVLE